MLANSGRLITGPTAKKGSFTDDLLPAASLACSHGPLGAPLPCGGGPKPPATALALLHIHHEGEHELLYLDEFNAVAQHHLDDEEQRIVPLAA